MNAIHHNPFRILSLPVDATPKAVNKQINEFRLYAELGKPIRGESDYEFLVPIERTPEIIAEACRKIEQPDARFQHAFFWFWNMNSVDQVALDLLALGNVEKAESLWLAELQDGEISDGSFSCAKNLATLFLARTASNGSLDKDHLANGIHYAGLCLQSEMLGSYSERLSVVKYELDMERLVHTFVDEACSLARKHLSQGDEFTVAQLIECFDEFPKEGQQYIRNKFAGQPIQRIEAAVASARMARDADGATGLDNGQTLITATRNDLLLVRDTLGEEDVQYQVIADKVATELLQCAVEYFNTFQDDPANDPGIKVLPLVKSATSIAIGERVRQRAQENLESVQEWCDGAEERERQAEAVEPLARLAEILGSAPSGGTSAAGQLLTRATPFLSKIEAVLGTSDDLYRAASSRVAMDALNMVVEGVNQAQITSSANRDIASMHAAIVAAQEMLVRIRALDMVPQARQHLSTNQQSLESLASSVNEIQTRINKANSSCYIATAVYGDYDHPNVCVLRQFRDRCLIRHFAGRLIVQTYYQLSPSLAGLLRHSRKSSFLVRRFLDTVVRGIQRWMR